MLKTPIRGILTDCCPSASSDTSVKLTVRTTASSISRMLPGSLAEGHDTHHLPSRGRLPKADLSEALLRRPHADALVSAPVPILHRGGLINPPHGSVNTLAACGRVRSAGDFPLAGLVGEAVSDLEVQREDVVGQKSDLPSVSLGLAGCAEGRCLPHGLPERVERGFGLSHQPVRSLAQLAALVHQASHRLARRLRPALYFHWKHRAAVEVRPDAVGQVRVTPWAPV